MPVRPAELGYLLPFYLEALLTPFGTLLNMLNNRRLCRCGVEAVQVEHACSQHSVHGVAAREPFRVATAHMVPCRHALPDTTHHLSRHPLPAGC